MKTCRQPQIFNVMKIQKRLNFTKAKYQGMIYYLRIIVEININK